MPTQRDLDIAAIQDELKANWLKWQDHVDGNCEFGAQVAAILNDGDDDKLGRLNDLRDQYTERCARYAIDSGIWYGMWGELKRAAGLSEPVPFEREGLPAGWKEAA